MAYVGLLAGLILSAPGVFFWFSEVKTTAGAPAAVFVASGAAEEFSEDTDATTRVPIVPFYSQFRDISDLEWRKLGCGIAGLAMLIELYKPGSASVDALLREGIVSGAFVNGSGWSHQGLARLAEKYGFTAESYDLSHVSAEEAFSFLGQHLAEGPVIASVYYKFEFGNPIPHLAVINGIDGGVVYYNDPSSTRGGESISVDGFKKAWKQRFIIVRPYALH